MVTKMDYQSKPDVVTAWTDTDFAGCKITRKSTSGGLLLFGNHVMKGWSTTQNSVALSSGEAEYYGLVKGASYALGFQSMLRDLGVECGIQVNTDASAAKGIASRKGLGKVRHIEVNQLWVQDKVADGSIVIKKVDGLTNVADAMTKHVTSEDIRVHLYRTNQINADGRHDLAPTVAE